MTIKQYKNLAQHLTDENLQWQIDKCLNKVKSWSKKDKVSGRYRLELISNKERAHVLELLNHCLREQNERKGKSK